MKKKTTSTRSKSVSIGKEKIPIRELNSATAEKELRQCVKAIEKTISSLEKSQIVTKDILHLKISI